MKMKKKKKEKISGAVGGCNSSLREKEEVDLTLCDGILLPRNVGFRRSATTHLH